MKCRNNAAKNNLKGSPSLPRLTIHPFPKDCSVDANAVKEGRTCKTTGGIHEAMYSFFRIILSFICFPFLACIWGKNHKESNSPPPSLPSSHSQTDIQAKSEQAFVLLSRGIIRFCDCHGTGIKHSHKIQLVTESDRHCDSHNGM